jgi:hypothetical protein
MTVSSTPDQVISQAVGEPVSLPKAKTSNAERLAIVGFGLYAIFAPHSIAGAEIALSLVAAAWLIRAVSMRTTGLLRTRIDLPVCLFLAWTVLSSFLSVEPRISIAKLQSVCVVFLLYLTRSFITRRTGIALVALIISSGVAGTIWSVIDLSRGRGVVIESIAPDSPFRQTELANGDAVWRVEGKRVDSIAEIDSAIKATETGRKFAFSMIRLGEHADFPGFIITDEIKSRTEPSGLRGSIRTYRFRASGWTRHYETYSETLQILAQLALGFAIAGFRRSSKDRVGILALFAALILTTGVAFTAMRSVLVALMFGVAVIAWRARDRRARFVAASIIALVVSLGLFSVWKTRTAGALELKDSSVSLRSQVARIGISRIALHPLFGHGMDSVKAHWREWGFPGDVLIHMHSTPLEIAFERGIPALVLWLWIMAVFWSIISAAEKSFSYSSDFNLHGFFLGALGAISGFFASSMVNYNFGDGEVALVFWFLMGLVIALAPAEITEMPQNSRIPADNSEAHR